MNMSKLTQAVVLRGYVLDSNFKLVVFRVNVWPKLKNLDTKKYLLFPDNRYI